MYPEHHYFRALSKNPASRADDNPLIHQRARDKKEVMNEPKGEAVDQTTTSLSLVRSKSEMKGSGATSSTSGPNGGAHGRDGQQTPMMPRMEMAFNMKRAAVITGKATQSVLKQSGKAALSATRSINSAAGSERGGEYHAAEQAIENTLKNKASALGKNIGRKVAQKSAKTAKSAVKTAGKLLGDLARAIAKLLGIGSTPVVVIAIAISVIGLVVGSAFGILIDDNDASTPSVPQLATDSEKRLQKKIDEIYDKISPEPDIVLMDFYSETPDGRIKLDKRLNNWPDILAIWAVRTTMADNLDVVALDERRQKMFRQVFDDMTSVEYEVVKDRQTETFVDETGEVREITVTVTTLLYTIISRTYPEMYREYHMTDSMISMTEELGEDFDFRMLASYAATDFNPLPYPRTGGGSAGEVVDYTVQTLPPSALADEAVLAASQYLGTPYSQLDCSKLTQTVYAGLGIELPRTAAEQARYIIENNRAIDPSDLQPGDLIFYALKGDNGRYMYVSHVAIYAGDGMIIDASSINGYTIYRDMDTFSESVTVLYGRP